MGNWTIIITGAGCHHNGIPEDADTRLKAFIEELSKSGQEIKHASFCLQGQAAEILIGGVSDAQGVQVPLEEGITLIQGGSPSAKQVALKNDAQEGQPPELDVYWMTALGVMNDKLDMLLEIARLEAKKSTLKKIEGGAAEDGENEKPNSKAGAPVDNKPEPGPQATAEDSPEKEEGAVETEAPETPAEEGEDPA